MLIIDGYNLLFARYPELAGLKNRELFEKAREDFIALLGRRVTEDRYEKIILIFDGQMPSKSARKGTRLMIAFSGEEKADALVIKTAREQTSARKTAVVTSDNEIIRKLKPLGFKIIRSHEFADEFLAEKDDDKNKSAEGPSVSKRKLNGISPEEAEKWLEIFGIDS
ncbi:MAG: NYN domain-containing protein [Planctomycetes bacterium]|nr:NYN domain-containing protein [Planctomycetota bacterium]